MDHFMGKINLTLKNMSPPTYSQLQKYRSFQ